MGFARKILGGSARMVLREVQRRPLRVFASSFGIAIAVGILVVGRFFGDAMTWMVDVNMHETQRWDVQVAFREPLPLSSLGNLRLLPGVHRVEGLRSVPVRVSSGPRHRSLAILGYPGDGTTALQRVVGLSLIDI